MINFSFASLYFDSVCSTCCSGLYIESCCFPVSSRMAHEEKNPLPPAGTLSEGQRQSLFKMEPKTLGVKKTIQSLWRVHRNRCLFIHNTWVFSKQYLGHIQCIFPHSEVSNVLHDVLMTFSGDSSQAIQIVIGILILCLSASVLQVHEVHFTGDVALFLIVVVQVSVAKAPAATFRFGQVTSSCYTHQLRLTSL